MSLYLCIAAFLVCLAASRRSLVTGLTVLSESQTPIRQALARIPDGWVNYAAYQSGEHKWIYDEQKVILLLQKIGFKSVAPSVFQAGVDPDVPLCRRYSFYVEAIK